jgi:hypothetical protein
MISFGIASLQTTGDVEKKEPLFQDNNEGKDPT